jgi:glycosyltransferase involved in cell wall biosynthesis
MTNNKYTFLAAVGDSKDPKTWSGIPYFFLQEAKKQKLIDEGLKLNPDTIIHKLMRIFWNLNRVLFFNEKGGYQYSNLFLNYLWKPHLRKVKGSRIINCFQLYPKSILNRDKEELYFFIDQTLKQLFEQYEVENIIGSKIITSSMILEKKGYLKAKKIIVHSKWCEISLINDYAVPKEKIFVIQPGANLQFDIYDIWKKHYINKKINFTPNLPLKLIFIGKEPIRKGLDRLLLSIKVAQNQGALITIRIIGCNKDEVKLHENQLPSNIEWMGFVDKSKAPYEYISLISNCDMGCLLSKAEAGGICLREFHALGLAVMYSFVGGSPEHAISNASIGISLNMTNQEIGEKILYYFKNREELQKLKNISFSLSENMLWSTTVNSINKLINN